MRSIEEETTSPFRDDLLHGLQREREECHGGPQRDQPGAHKRSHLAEEIKIHLKFDGIERDVHDLQTAHPCWPVAAVARMAAEGLRQAHDDIAWFGERGIDRHIADHTCHQSMVSVPRTEDLFEQFDTQCLDLVDVLGTSKPAVHRADVPLGGANADLGGEERSDRRARGRLRSEQIQTLPAAPCLIACHCCQHRLLHLLGRAAGVQDGPGIGEDARIMHFELLGWVVNITHGVDSSRRILGQRSSFCCSLSRYHTRCHQEYHLVQMRIPFQDTSL